MSQDRCLKHVLLSHHSSAPHPVTEGFWGSRDVTAESTDRIAYKSLKMLIKCWNRSHAFWSVRASRSILLSQQKGDSKADERMVLAEGFGKDLGCAGAGSNDSVLQ